jgi:hypothetical protein
MHCERSAFAENAAWSLHSWAAMSFPRSTERPRAIDTESDSFLEGGTFVAGVAIGIAPAVAAAGILVGSETMAVGLTGGLLLTGILGAIFSSGL